jgi:hypothetical protein
MRFLHIMIVRTVNVTQKFSKDISGTVTSIQRQIIKVQPSSQGFWLYITKSPEVNAPTYSHAQYQIISQLILSRRSWPGIPGFASFWWFPLSGTCENLVNTVQNYVTFHWFVWSFQRSSSNSLISPRSLNLCDFFTLSLAGSKESREVGFISFSPAQK